jgi:hypothetical protein
MRSSPATASIVPWSPKEWGGVVVRWQLERLDPPERRGEILVLDDARGRHQLGRSEACDLKLHTATASRQHAELWRREDGAWFVAACEGRPMLVDGEPLAGECELCEGLCLTLGGDRLRCRRVEPAAVWIEVAPPSGSEGRAGLPGSLWIGLGILLFSLAIVAILRFGLGG